MIEIEHEKKIIDIASNDLVGRNPPVVVPASLLSCAGETLGQQGLNQECSPYILSSDDQDPVADGRKLRGVLARVDQGIGQECPAFPESDEKDVSAAIDASDATGDEIWLRSFVELALPLVVSAQIIECGFH